MADYSRYRYEPRGPYGGCDSDCGRVSGPYCPVRPSGLNAFGGLYNCEEQLITLEEGCMETIPLHEPMASCNVTLRPNGITINDGGNYRVDFLAVMQAVDCEMDATIAVYANRTALLPLTLRIPLDDAVKYVSAFAIVTFNCGDELELVLSSASGGTVRLCPTLNTSLCVMRLGNSICPE
ncbi:hypothetical protein SDC9_156093 [bioreactor metagenome]|uniref:BclA C-terminal domain-containing protein n=1 Tax=bioreactor metagenome TaxID=1076179 RepID=A0A645F3A7_9ZZZZ